jgi:hypothetical protein
MLFLYHRYYDLVIFALPLSYYAGRVLACPGRGRWLYFGSALALLGPLYWRRPVLEYLNAGEVTSLATRVLHALMLPMGVWLTLLAMGLLALAERRRLLDQPP